MESGGKRTNKQAHRYKEQTGVYRKQGMGGGQMGEGTQKIQTSSYKINKSWGCNVEHGDYS